MKLLKTLAILLVIVVVFGAAMFGLNFLTGPIIAANNAGAVFAPLLAVMPEGASFTGEALIYDAANASASSLKEVPASILTVYQEANGLGYAIRSTAQSDYSTAPMEITIGVAADGKICGIQIDSYNDTASFDFRGKDPNYLPSYIGKDSALADIGTVSGSTYSSTAFKNAVSEAMGVLIANEMIAAGVKSDAQILTELIPTVHPGMTVAGNLKATQLDASGNITVAYKAENGSGFAYIMTEGEASFLAVVNAAGNCKVYNVEGTDVTADHAALADEAKAHAGANQKAYGDAAVKKFGKMVEGAGEVTALNLDTFNTVVYAGSFLAGDATYYGFYTRSIGFEQMDVYVVLDANGAIVKVDAAALFFETEYFPVDDQVDAGEYKGGFNGMTVDTFTGENAMIAGATMTSEAMKLSVQDAFAAFATIEKGGE